MKESKLFTTLNESISDPLDSFENTEVVLENLPSTINPAAYVQKAEPNFSLEEKVFLTGLAVCVAALFGSMGVMLVNGHNLSKDTAHLDKMISQAAEQIGVPKPLLKSELEKLIYRYYKYLTVPDKSSISVSSEVESARLNVKYKSALIMSIVSLKRTMLKYERLDSVSYVWDNANKHWKKEDLGDFIMPGKAPLAKMAHDNDDDAYSTRYSVLNDAPDVLPDPGLARAIENIEKAPDFRVLVNEINTFDKSEAGQVATANNRPHALTGYNPTAISIRNQLDAIKK